VNVHVYVVSSASVRRFMWSFSFFFVFSSPRHLLLLRSANAGEVTFLTFLCVFVCVQMYVFMYIYMWVCVCVCVCVHACIYV
jgi:hypothetical protein